jgi:hypothetical protein
LQVKEVGSGASQRQQREKLLDAARRRYSVTRARAETDYSKETLTAFDRIPSQKAALILLALKFGFRDDSVSIVTEGLGAKPFHGERCSLWTEAPQGRENGSRRLHKSASLPR